MTTDICTEEFSTHLTKRLAATLCEAVSKVIFHKHDNWVPNAEDDTSDCFTGVRPGGLGCHVL